MKYYTLEYHDPRNNTRVKRYFREKYLLNDYLNKNGYYIEGERVGAEEM